MHVLYFLLKKLMEPPKNSKKKFFFSIITKNITTKKIFKMENKHPEHFWSALNSLSGNKKKFDFRNTLNHFIFEKFIS
jgi:hypothetical protein